MCVIGARREEPLEFLRIIGSLLMAADGRTDGWLSDVKITQPPKFVPKKKKLPRG
jgi:hypothetical protein